MVCDNLLFTSFFVVLVKEAFSQPWMSACMDGRIVGGGLSGVFCTGRLLKVGGVIYGHLSPGHEVPTDAPRGR